MFFSGFTHQKNEIFSIYSKFAQLLSKQRYNCVQFDYRGHGDSSGELEGISFEDMVHDAELCYRYFNEINPIDTFVTFGLGTTIGAALVEKYKLTNFIAWSPKFEPFLSSIELFDEIASDSIYELNHYSSNVKVVNFLRSLGCETNNFSGSRVSAGFFDSLVYLKPVDILCKNITNILIVNAEKDLNLRTKIYHTNISKMRTNISNCSHIIIPEVDRFFKYADWQDQLFSITSKWIEEAHCSD